MASSHSVKLSIEELIARLEEITKKIENPETGLDSSISLYEEGLAIAEQCKKRLLEARKKIEVINPDLAGSWPDNSRTKDLFQIEP
ncbi:MAG: exodeoxyribonuclease VII small subunit [Chlorobiaceae bacterium]|nr:exodeoxyribonuclease VII small subunit [Chlorobiaceae bacterium]NTW11367.1 exodeoxyribonuclease VII small subunit [Chlorobiaceae bacterium]